LQILLYELGQSILTFEFGVS